MIWKRTSTSVRQGLEYADYIPSREYLLKKGVSGIWHLTVSDGEVAILAIWGV